MVIWCCRQLSRNQFDWNLLEYYISMVSLIVKSRHHKRSLLNDCGVFNCTLGYILVIVGVSGLLRTYFFLFEHHTTLVHSFWREKDSLGSWACGLGRSKKKQKRESNLRVCYYVSRSFVKKRTFVAGRAKIFCQKYIFPLYSSPFFPRNLVTSNISYPSWAGSMLGRTDAACKNALPLK